MYKKLLPKLYAYLELQLFLTLVSLPIFAHWGLPISWMSFISNALFTPLLTLFLLLSSFLFFSELLFLPNQLIAWALESLSGIWCFILDYGSNQWLFGFSTQALPVLIICSALTIYLKIALKRTKRTFRLAIFSALFIGVCTILWLLRPSTIEHAITTSKGDIHLFRANNETILYDPGAIHYQQAESTIDYTILPALLKTCGTTTIDRLIFAKPTSSTFKCAVTLLEKTCVNNLYIPFWQGNAPKTMLKLYGRICYMCKKTGTRLHRIGKRAIALCDKKLAGEPELSKYQAITFNKLELQ